MDIYELMKKDRHEWSIDRIAEAVANSVPASVLDHNDFDRGYDTGWAAGARHALEVVLLLMPNDVHSDHLIQTAGAESLYSENDMERGREIEAEMKSNIKE